METAARAQESHHGPEHRGGGTDAERALRALSARLTALGELDDVLQEVVDQSCRLLSADGAVLSLKLDGSEILQPKVMAGAPDAETRAWLRSMRLEPGSGTNALAAEGGAPVWTRDFRVDPRLPHGPGYGTTATRLNAIAIAAVPMHGPDRMVIGTLSISHGHPHDFRAEDLELLQALADQGAIAVLNAQLFERLRASEARYRFVVEHGPDLLFSTDADGRFTFVGESSARFTGYDAETLTGEPFLTIAHPTSADEVTETWRRVADDPTRDARIRFVQVRRDGQPVAVEAAIRGSVVDGRFAGVHGSLRDLSEIDRLEQDRRLHQAELAVAAERAHLARELHDSVTQALYGMTMTAKAVDLLLERGDIARARDRLDELGALQRDALAEMRALVYALRPASLERDGLGEALRRYADAMASRSGLRVELSTDLPSRLPAEEEDALYRIVQEALHNVVKHAHASHVWITVVAAQQGTVVTVDDDGIGFEPSSVPGGHLGVTGMRARAGLIGGTFEIGRRDRGGTRVRVRVRAPDGDRSQVADAAVAP